MVSEERMAALEARRRGWRRAMTRLDAGAAARAPRASRPPGATAPARAEPAAGAAPRPRRTARAARGRARAPRLEDLLGGRVLGWVGGLAVLVGLVFLSS